MTFDILLRSKVVRVEERSILSQDDVRSMPFLGANLLIAALVVVGSTLACGRMRRPMDFCYTLYDAGRRPALLGEGLLASRRPALPERLCG